MDEVNKTNTTTQNVTGLSTSLHIVYATAGNKIKTYKRESTGELEDTHFDIITPDGLGTISAMAITSNNRLAYAIINNTNDGDKVYMLSMHSNGSLGQINSNVPTIQTSASANSIVVSKDNRFVYVTSPTQICTYSIESTTGNLTQTVCNDYDNAPYTQITIGASGKYAFAISGKYAENIITFGRELSTGKLTYLYSHSNGSTKYNRSMAIPTTGHYLYTALKDNKAITEYKIDSATGNIVALDGQPSISTDLEPHSIAMTPDGQYVYATNFYSNTISMYRRNIDDGTLTHLTTPSIPASSGPDKICIDPAGEYLYVSTLNGTKSVLQYEINKTSGMLSKIESNTKTLNDTLGQIIATNAPKPQIIIESVNVTDGTLNVTLTEGVLGELTADDLNILQNVSQVRNINEVNTSFTGMEELLIISIIAISARQFLIKVDGMLPQKMVQVEATSLEDQYGMSYTDTAWHQTGVVDAEMIQPMPNAANVPIDTKVLVVSPDPINKDSFHLVDLMGEIEVLGSINLVDESKKLIFTPKEPLHFNTNYEVRMMTCCAPFSRVFTTESSRSRLMKIYTATNEDHGFPANKGLAYYDEQCNGNEMPGENDGEIPPYYKALLGASMRQPGFSDWPLAPVQNYYNIRQQFLGKTDPNGVLSGIRGTDGGGTLTSRMLDALILPQTALSVWTGIKVSYDQGNLWEENDPQTSCLEWGSAGDDIQGYVGTNNSKNIDRVFSQRLVPCSIMAAIYCVQQW